MSLKFFDPLPDSISRTVELGENGGGASPPGGVHASHVTASTSAPIALQ